jgi:tRNA-dihydrouridine synthase B
VQPATINNMDSLTQPFQIGDVALANRLVLAPLAGIGNWFVRLQARRYGAGLAVSEMISSIGVQRGNERTCREMLRIHPDEHPVAIQLFGADPDAMRAAAEHVAQAGADLIDINMGCPVPKVCRTGAGAALLAEPERAVALARAASAAGLPVTVKLRSGQRAGERDGYDLARRLVEDAGVAAIGFHPRAASSHHSGAPDHALAARLVQDLPVPVLLSGGLSSAAAVRTALDRTGAAAAMLARGALGNPWMFAELLGQRTGAPTRSEVLTELDWVMDAAVEHFGERRAARYLRKFYPWYAARLGARAAVGRQLVAELVLTETLAAARATFVAMSPEAPPWEQSRPPLYSGVR